MRLVGLSSDKYGQDEKANTPGKPSRDAEGPVVYSDTCALLVTDVQAME